MLTVLKMTSIVDSDFAVLSMRSKLVNTEPPIRMKNHPRMALLLLELIRYSYLFTTLSNDAFPLFVNRSVSDLVLLELVIRIAP